MKLVYPDIFKDFQKTLLAANQLPDLSYDNPITFHAYWDGPLTEKHLISIHTCYFYNIRDHPKRKIILWVERCLPNEWYQKIQTFAEIRPFVADELRQGTPLDRNQIYINRKPSFYSDYVRYLLLYRFGGVWFDLDIFFLRDLGPILSIYESELVVYTWAYENYPNGALMICTEPESPKIKEVLEYFIQKRRGFGFQDTYTTYGNPLPYTVLPCSWFDASWIDNPLDFKMSDFFKGTSKKITLDNFFKGAFCFHWHNQWLRDIEEDSPCRQLLACLD